MVQMDFFCFLASLLSEIDWQHFFFLPERDLGEHSRLMGPVKWKSFFILLLEAIQAQRVVFLLFFLINISFSTSTPPPPITVSPTRRKTSCPACRSLFLKPERSSSCLRCRLMTAARLVWASASKETSPGRRGRTWGSSSSPLSTEGLRTR